MRTGPFGGKTAFSRPLCRVGQSEGAAEALGADHCGAVQPETSCLPAVARLATQKGARKEQISTAPGLSLSNLPAALAALMVGFASLGFIGAAVSKKKPKKNPKAAGQIEKRCTACVDIAGLAL